MSAVARRRRPPGPVARDRRPLGDVRAPLVAAASRGGELGSLPIIVGLIIIAIVFQSQNSNFLTAGNFVNLIVQSAAYAMIGMGIVFVLLLGEIDLSVGFVSRRRAACIDRAAAASPDGNADRRRPVAIVIALAAGRGDRDAARPAHHQDRHPVVRRHARRPAGLERRRAAADRQPRHRDPAERLRHRPREQLHAARATAWILAGGLRRHLRGDRSYRGRMSRAQGRAADRPDRAHRACGSVAARGRARSSSPSPTRTAASRTCVVVARAVPALDVRAQPHAVRPPHLRGRRQRRGGAARRHQRRPHQDRVLRDLLARWRRSAASSSPRACARWTPNAGGGQILLYSIAAAVIGGTSLFGGRGHMKAAMLGALVIALDRQRARPARAVARARSSSSPAACCCWPSRSTRSRGGGAHDRQSMTDAAALGLLSTARINDAPRRRRGLRRAPRSSAVASRDARPRRRRYAARARRSRARTAPTRSCSPTPRSTPSTSRCRTRCTCRGRCAALRRASTCSARSRCRADPEDVEAAFALAARARAAADGGVHVAPPPADRRARASCSREGAVGELRHGPRVVRVLAARRRATPRCEPALDGGALMDVGCYCVSALRLLAGEPERVTREAVRDAAADGVDVALAAHDALPGRRARPRSTAASTFRRRHELEVVGTEARCSARRPLARRHARDRAARADGTRADRGRGRQSVPRTSSRTSPRAIADGAPPLLDRADASARRASLEALLRPAMSNDEEDVR